MILRYSLLIVILISTCLSSTHYIITTASTGGTFYPVGVGLSKLLTLKLGNTSDTNFSAIASDGSLNNIRLLEKKEAHFAMIQGLFGLMAWNGSQMYQNNPQKNLRSISMLWPNVEHFIVNKEFASTGTIYDLKNLYNQNFSIAENDSGSKYSGEILMDTLGVDYQKMNLHYLGYNQSAVALKQGKIKGMNTPASPPVSAVSAVFSSMGPLKMALLEFSDDDLKKIQKVYPIWKRYVIKAHTYPRQVKDINTIAQPNLLITDVDTPEDIVYFLTKTLYENLSFFNSVNKGTVFLSLQNAIDGLTIPLHKGALRYYQEMGLVIPSHLILSVP